MNDEECVPLRVVLDLLHSLDTCVEVVGNLQRAVESRDLIGQAKGILMVRQQVGSEEAFAILRRASQRSNRKLRDVAAQVVAGTAQEALFHRLGPTRSTRLRPGLETGIG